MASVSISPDLPLALRPLKTDLLNMRRQMPREQKLKVSIRHVKSWPYVELHQKNGPVIKPEVELSAVTKSVLGFPALLNCIEPTE